MGFVSLPYFFNAHRPHQHADRFIDFEEFVDAFVIDPEIPPENHVAHDAHEQIFEDAVVDFGADTTVFLSLIQDGVERIDVGCVAFFGGRAVKALVENPIEDENFHEFRLAEVDEKVVLDHLLEPPQGALPCTDFLENGRMV